MENKFKEKLVKTIFLIASLISILGIILIIFFIFKEGIPFIQKYGWKNFLLGKKWSPTNNPPSYGILPMIIGSLIVTFGGIIIGGPIGVLTSIYLSSFCKEKYYNLLNSLVHLMAGIPSIIYGFFALNVLVPLNRNLFGGTGMNIITASLLLGIMILPTIISVSKASIEAVDESFYQGSIALGATHEESVFKVVVPKAKSGVISSLILGLGRAIGETMAIILIAGNQGRVPTKLTDGVRTMTTNIVLEMSYATNEHRKALIATASILFVFVLIINLLFQIMVRREKNE